MQLAQLFSDAGFEVGTSFGTEKHGIAAFVGDVYNALNNGSTAVVVLDSYCNDDAAALLAESVEEVNNDDSNNENVLVLRCTDSFSKGKRKGEYYDAKTIMQRIDAKNAASVTDPDVETRGRVRFVSPLLDGSTLHGFTVENVTQ